MQMLAKVGAAMQRLFGTVVDDASKQSGVIQRRREFSPMSLAMTFVLGHLWKPRASVADLAKIALQAGAVVSPQAVDQRRTPQLVNFLERLFRESVKTVIGSSESLAPLLERFESVVLLDSTTIILPPSEKENFAGCGGSYNAAQAAVKFQTEFDLRSGALSHIEMEPGKSPDGATSRQHVRRGANSLRIADLGYFSVKVFAAMQAAKEFFLSRLQFGTGMLLTDGTPIDLLPWLNSQKKGFIDHSILLGFKDRLSCRLIAWRVPIEQANRRRQKLRAEMKHKKGKEPGAERLSWCDWSIFVTNVPTEMLTPAEAAILYRARWQIELLFKRWKSCGMVAMLTGSNDVHRMVALWSRLIACVVQHWLLVATIWPDVRMSFHKASQTIRDFAQQIAASMNNTHDLLLTLNRLTQSIQKTCRRNKRKKAGTVELLNNVALLDFRLN
jgi:hypothetical protein